MGGGAFHQYEKVGLGGTIGGRGGRDRVCHPAFLRLAAPHREQDQEKDPSG